MIKLLSHVRIKQATSKVRLCIASQKDVKWPLGDTAFWRGINYRSNYCFKSSALIVNGKYLHFIEEKWPVNTITMPYLTYKH